MNRDILIGSSGWIFAGIIAIATWYAEVTGYICPTCTTNTGLLIIGVAVIFVGLYLIAFNKDVERIMRRKR